MQRESQPAFSFRGATPRVSPCRASRRHAPAASAAAAACMPLPRAAAQQKRQFNASMRHAMFTPYREMRCCWKLCRKRPRSQRNMPRRRPRARMQLTAGAAMPSMPAARRSAKRKARHAKASMPRTVSHARCSEKHAQRAMRKTPRKAHAAAACARAGESGAQRARNACAPVRAKCAAHAGR